MSTICTCGLLKVRKVGTSTVDGIEVCNNCHRPIEFGAIPTTGADATATPAGGPSRGSDHPIFWIMWGAALILISLLVGTMVIAKGGPAFVLFITEAGSVTGFFMVLVGVIAKGVAIGLATDRRTR